MTAIEMSALAFAALMVLLALRVPIAIGMLIVGMGGLSLVAGPATMLSMLNTQMFYQFMTYDLSVIPMFMLMGVFVMRAGFSGDLFRCARAFLGHHRGGVAMATIGACAGFGAICGSSLATAATMGRVAMPELRTQGYSAGLSTATLAAGGSLGILIPPSLVLVICALLLETSIESLFQAAMIPGLLAALGYIVAIAIFVRFVPAAGPPAPKAPWSTRWATLVKTWPVFLIFVLVIGGIYFGWFTPTQAAAVGVVLAFLAAVSAGLRWRQLIQCLAETATATAMMYMILFGASVLNSFFGFARLPAELAMFVTEVSPSPVVVLVVMLGIFLALGCIMESLSMIVLLVPIFWPILQALDFGMPAEDVKIWFAILALMAVEIGMITPPIGLNVIMISAMAKDVPMGAIFRGIVPFLASDLVRVGLLVAVPAVTLVLPHVLQR
jgi:tripartite ATP-independent transporter DctM subunit